MLKKVFVIWLIILLFSNGLLNFAKTTKSQTQPSVIINELMWMGSSLSSYDEWIELKNLTDGAIDLSGWYLTKLSSGQETLMLSIPGYNIIDDFFVLSNYADDSDKCILDFTPDLVDSSVSLVNSQLQIKLYDSEGNLVDIADDGSGKPLSGEYSSGEVWRSMERNAKIENGILETAWHTSENQEGFKTEKEYGTPGRENSNSAPIAEAGVDQTVYMNEEVYFDASDSFDPDGDELVYAWNFGDGNLGEGVTPVHKYQQEGSFTATLFLSDSINEISDSLIITVNKKEEVIFKPVPDDNDESENDNLEENETIEENINYQFSDKILFNEIFPNPEGTDREFEFIELINLDSKGINLIGWKIFNGSKYFEFKDKIIEPESFLALKYEETGMYLRNSGLMLQLLDPEDKVINGVEYTNSPEGESFSRVLGTNSWSWTISVTEGEENEITEDVDDTNVTEVKNQEGGEVLGISEQIEVSIGEARRMEKGAEVIIKGFVSVVPDVFGTQYFYIFDGEAGIKIYSSKKLFPELKIGDYVEVFGKVSESSGEKKINIKDIEDIKRLSDLGEFPKAIRVSINKINDDLAGSLVIIEGTILDSGKTKILFSDNTGEIELYLKKGAGVNGNDFEEGSRAEILGIVVPYETGYRILPRTGSDIRLTGEFKTAEEVVNKEGEVLGITEVNEIEMPSSDNTNSLAKYLIVIISGLILCSGLLIFRWYRTKKQTA